MQQRPDVTRRLEAWHEDAFAPPAPDYLSVVLERTRHTRQRPTWASLERWLPMKLTTNASAAPRALQPAWILLIVLALLIVVAGIAIVGGRLLTPTPALPLGGAAVIAFASMTEASGGPVGDIHTVRADGTNLRQLTDVSRASGADQAPVFSPDGTRIVFRRYQGASNSIEVIDAGGGNRTTLWTSGAGRDPYCAEHDDFSWSPDGQTLVFAAHEACPGQPSLYAVPADGSAQAVKLLAPGTSGALPRFSPNGREVAFLGSEAIGATGLYVAEMGSAGATAGGLPIRRIVSNLEGSANDQWFPPQWSPDGTELAVAVGPFLHTGDIVVAKADGSGQRVLTTDQAANPTWSPDGKRIAFHRFVDVSERWHDRPCTMRVWVINADGSGERRLDPLVDGCVLPPIWSPDGTRLLSLLIVDDYFHVGVLAADGNDPAVVFAGSYGASWQPVSAALPPGPSFAAESSAP